MKTFDKMAAQGDVMFVRVDRLPENLSPAVAVNGSFEVAHSETGHSHVVAERSAQLLIDETNEFIAYLQVNEPTEVKHLRSFDTHESLLLAPGSYQVRRQREHTPEGYRRAAD